VTAKVFKIRLDSEKLTMILPELIQLIVAYFDINNIDWIEKGTT
jgi:hypothetical protein